MKKYSSHRNSLLWISVSVFSKVENWEHLYKESICAILNKFEKKKWISSHYIRFSFMSTHSLQVAFEVLFDNREEISQYIDEVLKNQVSKLQPVNQYDNISLLTESIFMPFPYNSVHYGLFCVGEEDGMDPRLKDCRQLLNIELLKSNSLSMDTIIIIEFCIILYTAYLFLQYSNQLTLEDLISTLVEPTEQLHNYKILFDQEKRILNSLRDQILNGEIFELIPWLKEWEALCQVYLTEMALSTSSGYSDLFRKIIWHSLYFAGLSDFQRLSVIYAVNSSYSELII